MRRTSSSSEPGAFAASRPHRRRGSRFRFFAASTPEQSKRICGKISGANARSFAAMLEQPQQKKPRTLRNMWMGFGVLAAIVIGYTAFVFWSRWQENQDIAAKEKAAQAAKERDEAEKSFEVLGGADFKIISFYAMPPVIHRGDDVDMCYGVSNAKSVKLDPPDVPSMFPSLDRCVKVAPKKTTTYTFTADDGKGNTQTQKLTIEVR